MVSNIDLVSQACTPRHAHWLQKCKQPFNVFGRSGTGNRNARGVLLMQWTMQHGLLIQSRLDNTLAQDEAWTCRRAMDLSLIQLDYILTSPKFSIEKSWCDFSIPIGLDHRCVHCQLKLLLPKPKKRKKILSLKNWRPNLDENNVASDFQSKIRSLLAANCTANMEVLENMLVQAGIHHGTVLKFRMHFRPSTELKTLRHSRRHSQTQVARKTLSLQIRKLHRRELRLWRSRHLATLLKYVSCWKTLRKILPRPSGRRSAQQPPVDEFASMLEALFVGPPAQASNFPPMLDPPWTWADLMQAIKRLKINKASDDCGLTAELLKVAPDEYLIAMLDAFNFILRTGQIPASWKLTMFTMLPKEVHSIQTSDFRPRANIRLFYKVFVYMVLNRIENVLELEQHEEQHGFRPRRRIEEHLLTTNILLDKATAAGRTIWTVSLDLSKAFDRVHWPALWAALHDQGVSEHCIWLLQHIYDQQIGEVVGEWGRSRNFAITAGVKQGCVLSPRLFSATLEWAGKMHPKGQPKAKYSQQNSWITQCMLKCRRIWCMFFRRGLPTSILADTSLGT